MNLYLQVRFYTGGDPVCDVWIMEKDGDTISSVMHGHMTTQRVEGVIRYMERLGVAIVEERSPLEGKR